MRRPEAVMASMLTLTGVAHFARPKIFDSIVPPQLGNPRFWTYASGAAELSCAALLTMPTTRRAGGFCTAALMVAVFPANIYSVRKFWNDPTARTLALARLPLQIPLIRTSLKIARDHQGT